MGLPKDYHLSKRFYDAAAEKSTEGMPRKFRAREFQYKIRMYILANLPSTLALMWLAGSYVHEMISTDEWSSTIVDNWDILLVSLLSGLLTYVYIVRNRNRR